jgi:hypothetical protein
MGQAVKRLLAFGFGTLAALLLVAVVLWWWAAPALVRRAIDTALADAGLPPFAYRIGALSWGHLQLDEISAGAGELAAQRIEVQFSLDDLLARRIDAAAIRGLSLRAQRGEHGWSVGALDAWLRAVASARPRVARRRCAGS